MKRKKQKRKLVAEINVVPYIDVTLVLMVIFMITAPLLMQGVKVDLPIANSAPINSEERDPFIVSIKNDGSYWIDEKGVNRSKSLSFVKDRVEKLLRQQPETPILVWGDSGVDYGAVVNLMTELQRAGALSVGLVTEPPRQ
ncbi:MAG: protein TolR [Porticoccaceae bacterium]|nr:protein TolR [Porticoccaceae bacterium]